MKETDNGKASDSPTASFSGLPLSTLL